MGNRLHHAPLSLQQNGATTFGITTLSIMTFRITIKMRHTCIMTLPSVIMLSVFYAECQLSKSIMLSSFMTNVILLNVMAPSKMANLKVQKSTQTTLRLSPVSPFSRIWVCHRINLSQWRHGREIISGGRVEWGPALGQHGGCGVLETRGSQLLLSLNGQVEVFCHLWLII